MLTAFTAGLLLITVSELGDKTFCIALLLATRFPRRLVFAGVVAALAAMTLLSVGLGQFAALLPQQYVKLVAVILFIGMGLNLLYAASRLSTATTCDSEIAEAAAMVDRSFAGLSQQARWQIILQSFGLTFAAEWGDRTQFATVALAAKGYPVGVALGAVLGHTLCAAIAVIGGRFVAGRISERLLMAIGGGLFLLFGVLAWLER